MAAKGDSKSAAMAEYKEAQTAMKTGLFKWKPDYLMAVGHFEKAARLFMGAGQKDMYVSALKQAAECQLMLDNTHTAGQHLEAAGLEVCNTDVAEGTSLLRRAGEAYRTHGDLRKASSVYVKAAQAWAGTGKIDDEVEAILMTGVSVFDGSDQTAFSLAALREALNFCAQHKRFTRAMDCIDRIDAAQVTLNQNEIRHRNPLAKVVLCLAMGDAVRAASEYDAALSEMPTFGRSNEGKAAEELIRAMENSDADALAACVKKPAFGYLENQVGRLARSLRIGEGQADKSSTARTYTAPAAKTSVTQAAAKASNDANRAALFSVSGQDTETGANVQTFEEFTKNNKDVSLTDDGGADDLLADLSHDIEESSAAPVAAAAPAPAPHSEEPASAEPEADLSGLV